MLFKFCMLKRTGESAREMHVAVYAKIGRIYDLVGTWVYIPISAFEIFGFGRRPHS